MPWRSHGSRERQQLNRLRRPRPPPPRTTRTGVQVNGNQRGEVSSNVRLESSGRRTRIPSTSRGAVWTEEPTDPAKERRRSGLLDRLNRAWSGSKSSDAVSADRASATAGSGGASRSAKAGAAKSPAQSTNPAAGHGTGRMPKTATLASFTTVQGPPGVPPASASAPPLPSPAPLPGGVVALAAGSNAASASLGKAFSGDGQQTLPLESLPQPALPAPFTPGGEPTTFQEVATNAETPNAALRVSEQQSLPFHKRFFQGYPALVLWFPKHIPKPPEEPDEPEPPRRLPLPPGTRRLSPCRSTRAIR